MSNFDELIQDQIPRLRRYALALVGDRTRADDLVQDTLERALTRFHLWRRGRNVRAWLFTIMHNIFVNQHHAERARGTAVDLDESTDTPVGDRADLSMQVRDLQKALEQLPVENREVLLLVGLEQLTYEEVAEILGIPLGTVMSRLSRGRERLHSLMSGQTPALRRVK